MGCSRLIHFGKCCLGISASSTNHPLLQDDVLLHESTRSNMLAGPAIFTCDDCFRWDLGVFSVEEVEGGLSSELNFCIPELDVTSVC